MTTERVLPLKIGIIGAGFSGTALAVALHRMSNRPLDIVLFDKTGCFGMGDAYRTPFPFHLLNVRARDMSALESEAGHFVDWLANDSDACEHIDKSLPLGDQFVSRYLYHRYLKDLLAQIQQDTHSNITVSLEAAEVVDVIASDKQASLVLSDKRVVTVDKVILALGNNLPAPLPFPVTPEVKCITNPWDYSAPKQIPSHASVLIVGTGLSMVDTVLTLHAQHHQGSIYAVSRHGLLPLSHADTQVPFVLMQSDLPETLSALTKELRAKSQAYSQAGGDWRSVINALRHHVPALWGKISLADKKRFLRHVMPYWNIHRHRLHNKIADLLTQLMKQDQLHIVSGLVMAVEKGKARIKLRGKPKMAQFDVDWIVNCLGPAPTIATQSQPLIQALLKRRIATLDALNLGFDISATGALREPSGKISSLFYTLGSLRKGTCWEVTAVPEIRKQGYDLAKHLLD